jgi:hypothetical protein
VQLTYAINEKFNHDSHLSLIFSQKFKLQNQIFSSKVWQNLAQEVQTHICLKSIKESKHGKEASRGWKAYNALTISNEIGTKVVRTLTTHAYFLTHPNAKFHLRWQWRKGGHLGSGVVQG